MGSVGLDCLMDPPPTASESTHPFEPPSTRSLPYRARRGLSTIGTDAAAATTGGSGEQHEFQAETRQLLDIVIHSVYTDKEVFLRELISNASVRACVGAPLAAGGCMYMSWVCGRTLRGAAYASPCTYFHQPQPPNTTTKTNQDALEKLRHIQVAGEAQVADASLPLEIRLTTDEAAGTITLEDTGLGMSRGELVSNLGTIARSGSKAFVKELQEQGKGGADASGIIGQFGASCRDLCVYI